MNLTLIRSMTRSAVFELENELCYRPAHPFTVALNGKTVYEACNTNVFSLFSLLPGTTYTVEVQAEGETLKLDFTTEAETFFVDAARYGLVADGETDNTVRLQAALSTCPKGGTVYVPAGRYRTASLFMKSNTTLYLEKGAVLLGDNDRTHYPILPGVLPSENEVDEYYLTGWEGNPLDSFAGLLNITQVHDVVVTGEGTLDCDAENGDWWVNPKVKRIAWRPRAVAAVDSENVCLHGITVQNSYSWTIHPIFVKHLDLLNFNINNPYNAPNTDGIDPESCEYIRIIGVNIHVGDDCIAMKASKVFLGMKLKRSCEHTVIRNCLLDKGHGGIVIGSEMSGGVKDMVVTQCLMDHTDRGLRVKTRRGRGNTAVIDGLVFRNVEMRGVKAPFVINMFYFCDPDGHGPYVQCREAMPVDEYTPKLGSLTMEDIVATDAQFAGCYFDGLPEQPIERVSMKNVTITFDPNAEAGQAAAGVIADQPERFGNCLVLELLPGSQGIYGFAVSILILIFSGLLGGSTESITFSRGLAYFAASLPVGFGGLLSAIHQGKVSAAGIQMLAKRADGFGNGMMLALMVETYALLSLIVSVFLVLFA